MTDQGRVDGNFISWYGVARRGDEPKEFDSLSLHIEGTFWERYTVKGFYGWLH